MKEYTQNEETDFILVPELIGELPPGDHDDYVELKEDGYERYLDAVIVDGENTRYSMDDGAFGHFDLMVTEGFEEVEDS